MAITQHMLHALEMGIDTHQEPIAYVRKDCHICRSEGFVANTRVLLCSGEIELIATLNVVQNEKLPINVIGLSDIAYKRLQCSSNQEISISHAPVVASMSLVRKKIYGKALTRRDMTKIVEDISKHNYSDIEIASFLSACAGKRMTELEIVYLTKAMVATGRKLTWGASNKVFDKHCIGGLPGNRTTPIVVSIVSASGLLIPKTSSRAITSPAGTADMMESLANVNLDISEIKHVVAKTGACLVWGGAVNLSPADDMLIRIERALDIDGEGQLIASVLSKKIAAGSTHVVIDIPVGETAKVRSEKSAQRLSKLFTSVGKACGIVVRCLISEGNNPVGVGIGPAEEAKDVLSVFSCEDSAPQDLKERALTIAANIFDLNDGRGYEAGLLLATKVLNSGEALRQFNRIVLAQGKPKKLGSARYRHTETSMQSGVLVRIDNRKLARLAKLAGAPFSLNAGLRLYVSLGSTVSKGCQMFTILSDSYGELNYALDYYYNNMDIFYIEV